MVDNGFFSLVQIHWIKQAVIVSILFVIVLCFKRIVGLIYRIIEGILPEYPVRVEAEVNKSIHTELIELRAFTSADRSYLFRFHNGMEFLPSHPAWKLSCTHEVVKHGVSYESAKLQGTLVSLIPNIIGAVLTGTTSAPGFHIPKCPQCPYHVKCLRENKRVVIINVDDMEPSYCRYHLESQNIMTTILCGIAQDGNVYGMVGLDFCGVRLPDEKILEVAQRVCRTTEKVQYYLKHKKDPLDMA